MKVFIFGANGHAKVAIDILELSGFTIIGLLDDNLDLKGKELLGYPILGNSEIIPTLETNKGFIAIGSNRIRLKISERLLGLGVEFINAIHPTSTISKHATVGNGVMIGARSVVNAGATISDYAIINTNALIEHDCFIGQAAHICPSVNLAGTVNVGSLSMIGIGSAVRQNISIGENTTIGASSVVVKDIESNKVAFGQPCKVTHKVNE